MEISDEDLLSNLLDPVIFLESFIKLESPDACTSTNQTTDDERRLIDDFPYASNEQLGNYSRFRTHMHTTGSEQR